MNKLFFASMLASSALAGTVHAQGTRDTGPYITLEGGAVKQEGAGISSPAGFEHTNRFKTGWEAGAAIGYDYGHFRLEAEGFYNRSTMRSEERALGTPLPNGTFTQADGLRGRTSTYAGMGNVLLGLGHWGGVKGYVGAGVGYARVRLDDELPAATRINAHDSGFAWQALAGLSLPISHNLDLGMRYRYFRPDGADHFNAADGSDRRGKLRSHSLLATLTYNFGAHSPEPASEPAAAPPPPAPPPPAPPPPPLPVAASCNRGPFITFFDWDKAEITADAASILDSAIQAYGNCNSVAIALAGYTDSSGTPAYNLGLATRRDQAVAGYLASHGVPSAAITSRAFGEANQRVPTADGVRELQNRRVEISYGPGSGN
jgi:outer membrane protein OmpA-like peptidoglycan-associated protein